jgi:hypothetical protein
MAAMHGLLRRLMGQDILPGKAEGLLRQVREMIETAGY